MSPWAGALAALEDDLDRRAVAAQTARAYRSDAEQFAAWASERGNVPGQVDTRAVRLYAASLSERGLAPSSVARKLAALRAFFRAQVELGLRKENPADLVSSPRRPRRLPRALN